MRLLISKYKPISPASHPTYTPSKDVSLVVVTLNPSAIFKDCLLKWYGNKPLEIIIATTELYHEAIQEMVTEVVSEHQLDPTKIRIVTSEKGIRLQFIRGINEAKGSIIAKSDDQILWSPTFLTHMLAPFEDPKIGAVAPPVVVNIPESRRSQEVITPWEVAGTKYVISGVDGHKARYVAARWHWVLGGMTVLFRADIVRDTKFQEAFTSETLRGKPLDAGDDTFYTRWLFKHGWIIATQHCDETRAWRTVKRSPVFINQILRWERSSIRNFLLNLVEIPQTYQ